MDKHRCLKVALQISAKLQSELGQGIDAQRMVMEPLYRRDVLLVCDAMVGTEAQSLAASFRQAFALEPPTPLLRTPLAIGSLLGAVFGKAEAAEKPETPTAPLKRQPGAATRRPQPPGRPRRTAVRPPHHRAAR
jgi:hypothetical protein